MLKIIGNHRIWGKCKKLQNVCILVEILLICLTGFSCSFPYFQIQVLLKTIIESNSNNSIKEMHKYCNSISIGKDYYKSVKELKQAKVECKYCSLYCYSNSKKNWKIKFQIYPYK